MKKVLEYKNVHANISEHLGLKFHLCKPKMFCLWGSRILEHLQT